MDSDYKLRVKPITTAAKLPEEAQVRDTFETPRYATELLIPFIPKNFPYVWECAAGNGRISKVLKERGFWVTCTDIRVNQEVIDLKHNFLDDIDLPSKLSKLGERFSVITNPPFSIKEEFIEKAFEMKVPFAFLINADYSGSQINWIKRGCEKIIPTRRIGFLTPNILKRIHEGETYELILKRLPKKFTLKEYKETFPTQWNEILETYTDIHNYKSIEECPQELLYKYTSSQFHSMWLTYGFELGQTETFVDLDLKSMKERII